MLQGLSLANKLVNEPVEFTITRLGCQGMSVEH